MNKFLKYTLIALGLLTIGGFILAKLSVGSIVLGSADPKVGERDYLQQEIDSLNKRYTQLSSELYNANISLFEANKQLEHADSLANGGNYMYIVTFQCTQIESNMVQDTTPNSQFLLVLPVSREFYNVVREGNVLQAGVDYGFKYGQDVLYGKHVVITNKQIIKSDGTN